MAYPPTAVLNAYLMTVEGARLETFHKQSGKILMADTVTTKPSKANQADPVIAAEVPKEQGTKDPMAGQREDIAIESAGP